MNYEILQMEIIPLNAVGVNVVSVANGGRNNLFVDPTTGAK